MRTLWWTWIPVLASPLACAADGGTDGVTVAPLRTPADATDRDVDRVAERRSERVHDCFDIGAVSADFARTDVAVMLVSTAVFSAESQVIESTGEDGNTYRQTMLRVELIADDDRVTAWVEDRGETIIEMRSGVRHAIQPTAHSTVGLLRASGGPRLVSMSLGREPVVHSVAPVRDGVVEFADGQVALRDLGL